MGLCLLATPERGASSLSCCSQTKQGCGPTSSRPRLAPEDHGRRATEKWIVWVGTTTAAGMMMMKMMMVVVATGDTQSSPCQAWCQTLHTLTLTGRARRTPSSPCFTYVPSTAPTRRVLPASARSGSVGRAESPGLTASATQGRHPGPVASPALRRTARGWVLPRLQLLRAREERSRDSHVHPLSSRSFKEVQTNPVPVPGEAAPCSQPQPPLLLLVLLPGKFAAALAPAWAQGSPKGFRLPACARDTKQADGSGPGRQGVGPQSAGQLRTDRPRPRAFQQS